MNTHIPKNLSSKRIGKRKLSAKALHQISLICFALTIAGCSSTPDTPKPVPKPEAAVVPTQVEVIAEPGLSAKERFRKAISSLENGEIEIARAELLAYQLEIPSSDTAADLLQQIDTASSDYYPSEFFTVSLESGQSLSTLAKKYLGTPLAFYALAKYNGIDNPSKVLIGSELRIPLNAESKLVKAEEAAQLVAEKEAAIQKTKALKRENAPKALSEYTEPELRAALLDAHNKRNDALSIAIVDALKVKGLLSSQDNQILIKAIQNEAAKLAETKPAEAATLYDKLSDLYVVEGSDVAAFEAIKTANTLNSENVILADKKESLKQQIVEKYHREASTAFRQQSLEEAIGKWDIVLAIDPSHANAMAYRTQALELKEKLELLKGS